MGDAKQNAAGRAVDGLAQDMERMGFRGLLETKVVYDFSKLMTDIQDSAYDFGLVEDNNYVVPLKISSGTARQLGDAATRSQRKVREKALAVCSALAGMKELLEAAQKATFRAMMAAFKYEQFEAKKLEMEAFRANSQRERQALSNSLTSFERPSLEQLQGKRARVARDEPNLAP